MTRRPAAPSLRGGRAPPVTATDTMRHAPAIIAACALAAAALVVRPWLDAPSAGLPTLALLTFAVAAFSGPVP